MEFLPEACVAVRRVGSPNASENWDTPAEGIIVAVGPGAEFLPPQARVGDRVYFGPGSGIEIDLDGKTLVLLAEAELLRDTGLRCSQEPV